MQDKSIRLSMARRPPSRDVNVERCQSYTATTILPPFPIDFPSISHRFLHDSSSIFERLLKILFRHFIPAEFLTVPPPISDRFLNDFLSSSPGFLINYTPSTNQFLQHDTLTIPCQFLTSYSLIPNRAWNHS